MADDEQSRSRPEDAAWPAGGGELGALIRAFDWGTTPLGPLAAWPERLRAVVELLLAGPQAMALIWGPGATLLYNAGYAQIIGARHPAALGHDTFATFPETRSQFEASLAPVWAGEALQLADQRYPFSRGGPIEDAWFDVAHAPVRDEDGAVRGILSTMTETTARVRADRARDASEAHLRLATEAAALYSWEHDPQAGTTVFSANTASILGAPAPTTPEQITAYTHPDDRARVAETGRRAIEEGLDHFEYEFRSVAAPGEVRQFHVWCTIVRDAAGDPIRSIGITQDITARRATEAALRESEARARLAVEAGDLATWDWDLVADAVRWNARHYTIFGLSPGDGTVAPANFFARVHPDERERLAAALDRSRRERTLFAAQFRAVRADGAVRWMEGHGRVTAEAGGRPTRMNGVMADVTDRVEAEEALRASEERLRLATRAAGISTFQIDVATDMLEFDANVLTVLYGREALAPDRRLHDWGPLVQAWLRPEDAARHTALLRATMRGEGDLRNELSVRDPATGAAAWIETQATLVRDIAGGPGRVVGIMRNITDGVEAAQALRAAEERRAFLLALSDALRPLGDAAAVEREATRLLGEMLGADRVFYAAIEADGDTAVIHSDYARGIPSGVGLYALSAFAPTLVPEWRAGRTTATADVDIDPRFTDAQRAAYASVSSRAAVGVPLVKGGRLVALLGLNQAAPRAWTGDEIAFIEDVAERTWAAIERTRAEATLRESEARQRFLLELGDRMRAQEGPDAVIAVATRALGEHLGASRIVYAEIDDAAGLARIRVGWEAPGVPPHPPELRLADFGGPLLEALRAGEIVRFDDVAPAPAGRDDLAALDAIAIRAGISVPLIVGGRFAANLNVHQDRPRAWTDAEVALAAAVAERTWAAVERARAEAALHASEARFRTVIANLPGGATFVVDRDLRYRLAEGEALHAAGYRPDDFLGRTLAEVLDLALAARQEPFYRRALGGEPFEDEHGEDGRTYLTRGVPLHDEDGTVEAALALSFDITDRRRAEAALLESEARFRSVANLVPDLLWQSEPDGSATWYNDRWMEYTGQTFDEAVGWGWADAIHPDDRAASVRRYRGAAEAGTALLLEHRIRRHDGAYRWFLVRAEPQRDERGDVARVYGTATDIHEARTARDELEAQVAERTAELRVLSARLLAVREEEQRHLSRELHDQIGQLLTGLRLTLAAPAPDAAALDRARDIADDLLTRVRALVLDLRPPALDQFGLLAALRDHLARYTRQTGVQVELRHHGADRRFPPAVETTAYRIVQEALTNVARHAGTDHAVVLVLGDGVLIVQVRDEGRGFDPDTAEAARVSAGLAGMRERAALLGGTLAIDAIPGEGTTVVAELPLGGGGE